MLNRSDRESGDAARSRPRPGDRDEARRRSFCFLDRGGDRWSVFLATYAGGDGRWRGYFTFRTAAEELVGQEIRTADVFVENTEAEVDARARGLGRPLLVSLLESALHTHERRQGTPPDVGRWFRRVLASRSEAMATPAGQALRAAGAAEAGGRAGSAEGAGSTARSTAGAADGDGAAEPSLSQLRSLYDSYRIDQVSHLIALVEPAAFRELVDRLLDGREIDFRASDRLQLAMIVVQELERRLPLPPFEVWVEDYMARPDVYQRYSHSLHRESILPE